MATKLPRIAVTLPANTIATLGKLARLQKRPRSAIAAELLVEMTPALERIAAVLEAALVQRAKLPQETAHRLQALEELLGAATTFGLERLEQTIQAPRHKASAPAAQAQRAGRRRGH